MEKKKAAQDPVQRLFAFLQYLEKAAFAASVAILAGTAGYVTIHAVS
ncbi:hypothetical protein [Alicyclobacillus acidocaldarius]|nr:hypothetical protein [Alicyclobacillus acidocaldarius]